MRVHFLCEYSYTLSTPALPVSPHLPLPPPPPPRPRPPRPPPPSTVPSKAVLRCRAQCCVMVQMYISYTWYGCLFLTLFVPVEAACVHYAG